MLVVPSGQEAILDAALIAGQDNATCSGKVRQAITVPIAARAGATTAGVDATDASKISVHCSAMAIDSTVVVTAAHCFVRQLCGGGVSHIDPLATRLYFVQGPRAKKPQRWRTIEDVSCDPDFDRERCDADVALARLDSPLPDGHWWQGEITAPQSKALKKVGYGWFLAEYPRCG